MDRPTKRVIISRHNGYHGSTMGGASLGGMKPMHAQGGLPIPGIVHIAQPYWYGEGGEQEPETFGAWAAEELARKIDEIGADNVAAFIGEPVQGAGGVIIPPRSYWPTIQRICRERDILLVSDEVICGFGRTGEWFGHQASGIRPDIVTMAKGITSAYVPLAATVTTDEVFAAFTSDGADLGRLRHISTFGGHPAGCAVAVENLAIMEEEGLVARSAELGAELLARLRDALDGHPLVGEVRGRGLLIGIELVADQGTRVPAAREDSAALVAAAQGHGLLMARNADTAAGLDNVLQLAPPLSLTDADADHIVSALTACFEEHRSAARVPA
jgi:putrescine---pyruvate transaminase